MARTRLYQAEIDGVITVELRRWSATVMDTVTDISTSERETPHALAVG